MTWTLALLARLRTGLADGTFGAVRDAVAAAFGRVYDAV